MRTVIYSRVSTSSQSLKRQINELRELSSSKGWEVTKAYGEVISGAAKNSQREELSQRLKDGRAGKVKRVIISDVSRLGRNVLEALKTVEELHSFGISIYILNMGLETLTNGKKNPLTEVMLTTMLSFAQMERELIRERVKSGLEEAKRSGKTLGRPKGRKGKKSLKEKYSKELKTLKANENLSLREAAKLTGLSVNTIRKLKEEL